MPHAGVRRSDLQVGPTPPGWGTPAASALSETYTRSSPATVTSALFTECRARTWKGISPESGPDVEIWLSPATGSDSADGISKVTAVRTFTRAVELAKAPGSIINVVGGTHAVPYSQVEPPLSGDAHTALAFLKYPGLPGKPITVRGEPGKRVRLRVTYEPSDLVAGTSKLPVACYGFWVAERVRHIVIEGIELSHMQVGVVVGNGCEDITLRRLDIHRLGADPTYIADGGWPNYHIGIDLRAGTQRVTIDGCTIHDLGLSKGLQGNCCPQQTGPKCVNAGDNPYNHNVYNHSHGMYLQGFDHVVRDCAVWNIHNGAQIKIDGNIVGAGLPDEELVALNQQGVIDSGTLGAGYKKPSHTIARCCFGPDANPSTNVFGGIVFVTNVCRYGPKAAKSAPMNPAKNVRFEANLFAWRQDWSVAQAPILIATVPQTHAGGVPGGATNNVSLIGNEYTSESLIGVRLPTQDTAAPPAVACGAACNPTAIGDGNRYTLDPWIAPVQDALPAASVEVAKSNVHHRMGRDKLGVKTVRWFVTLSGSQGRALFLNDARLHAIRLALVSLGLQGKALPDLQLEMVGNRQVLAPAMVQSQTTAACPGRIGLIAPPVHRYWASQLHLAGDLLRQARPGLPIPVPLAKGRQLAACVAMFGKPARPAIAWDERVMHTIVPAW